MHIKPHGNMLLHNCVFKTDYMALCTVCNDQLSHLYKDKYLCIYPIKYRTSKTKLTFSGRIKLKHEFATELSQLKMELPCYMQKFIEANVHACTVTCEVKAGCKYVTYFTLTCIAK